MTWRLRGRCGPLNRRAQVAGIDLQQELSGLDVVALVDRQARDTAHLVGTDVDDAFWLNFARSRDDRLEIALLDRFHVDRDRIGSLEPHVRERDGAEEGHQAETHQDLLVPGQWLPPKLVITAAMMSAMTAYIAKSPIAIGCVGLIS